MQDRSRPATIADVARRAGVAKSTVSNYLSGLIRVAPKTGEKIAEAIVELDYRPAESARSLTSRKRTIQRLERMDVNVPALTTIGHVSVDFVARVDRLPVREDRIKAHEILKTVGGPAANVAAFAAGLSDRWKVACSLLTTVGNDVDSDWAITELARRSVDVLTPSGRGTGHLARALVLVEPSGQRTIVAEPVNVEGLALELFLSTQAPHDRKWCLHFEGFQVPYHLTQILAARKAGFRTSMHTTGLPATWLADHSDEMFAAFNMLAIQQETLSALPGCPLAAQDAVTWLAGRAADATCWPEVVIVSQRLQGAYLIQRGAPVTRCRNEDLDVKDETGAGDALVGTFIALWLHDVPAAVALSCACAAAGLVAMAYGAQELRPSGTDLAPFFV